MSKSTEQVTPDFKRLLRRADIGSVTCMDERQSDINEKHNPVNLPGATEVLVDALKAILHCTEDEAWERVRIARIPISGHTDDEHGHLGCGYRKLVATNPGAVGAPEAVPAEERYNRIATSGTILNYHGDHQAKYAVMNHVKGMSIDQDQMPRLGIFSVDLWAVEVYAGRLKVNQKQMVEHVRNAFQGAVSTLTNGQINEFQSIL